MPLDHEIARNVARREVAREKKVRENRREYVEAKRNQKGKNLIFFLNKATSNYFLDDNFFRQTHTLFNCQNLKENLSEETGLRQLQEDRLKHRKNPLIGYLDINSLRNKITDLRVIMKTLSLDYLILSENNIDESFPTSQFNAEGYEIRARRDRDNIWWGSNRICTKMPYM